MIATIQQESFANIKVLSARENIIEAALLCSQIIECFLSYPAAIGSIKFGTRLNWMAILFLEEIYDPTYSRNEYNLIRYDWFLV